MLQCHSIPPFLLLLRINTVQRRIPESCVSCKNKWSFLVVLRTFRLNVRVLLHAFGSVLHWTHFYLVFHLHRHVSSWRDTSRASLTSQPQTLNLRPRKTCGASCCLPAGTSQVSRTQRSPTLRRRKTIRIARTMMLVVSTPMPAARPRTAQRSSPLPSTSPPAL